MKTIFFSMVLSASFSHVVMAQTSGELYGQAARQNLQELSRPGVGNVSYVFDNRYQGIQGSPFFLNYWTPATIILKNKSIFENVEFKFDIYSKNLVFQNEKKQDMQLDANKVMEFSLIDKANDKVYNFRRLEELSSIEPKFMNEFCVVVYEGKQILALLPQKKLLKADYKGGYSANRTSDELIDEKDYYLITSDKQVEKIKLNKKSLLKVVTSKLTQMELYLKSEKIDAGTEQGWVKALSYYDSL